MMNEEQRSSSLKNSVRDAVSYSVMVGAGESYVTPAAIFLKAGNLDIGLLTSIPQLAGGIAQVLSAEAVDRFSRRRAVYLTGAILQAISWIPMIVALFLTPPFNIVALIAGFTLYVMAVNFSAPAWTSTMGDIVPEDRRGAFFGRRNRDFGVGLVISLVTAGLFLHEMGEERERSAFASLFAAAMIARFASTFYLSRMIDPPYSAKREDYFSMVDFIRRAPSSNFARFVLFVTAMFFSVCVVGPFFTVYILRHIEFTYVEFAATQLVHMMAMYLTMVYWGKLGDRFGNRRIMKVSSIGIVIVPMLWVFVYTLPAALVIQFFAGFFWAGFNLSATNFIYDAVTPGKRARCTAYFTFFTTMAVFVGATLGGLLSESMGKEIAIGGFHIEVFSELHWLMIISGLLRLLTVIVFLPAFREVRDVNPIGTGELIMRIAFLRPYSDWIFDALSGKQKRP